MGKQVSTIPNKFKLSEDANSRLRTLKMKTGLEDWTIARLGLCFSLGDINSNNLEKYVQGSNEKGAKEFNRYTLTGERDAFYIELVKSYSAKYVGDRLSEGDVMRAHLNRGIIGLSQQGLKSLADLATLLASK
jgi:DNA sulfur modification protein DndE